MSNNRILLAAGFVSGAGATCTWSNTDFAAGDYVWDDSGDHQWSGNEDNLAGWCEQQTCYVNVQDFCKPKDSDFSKPKDCSDCAAANAALDALAANPGPNLMVYKQVMALLQEAAEKACDGCK